MTLLRRILVQLGIAVAFLAVLDALLGMVGAERPALVYSQDPALFWRLKPHVQEHRQDSPESTGRILTTVITTNSLGLRDEEIPDPKPTGEYRVLLLGDSSIFGHGVTLPETFVKQLEARLQAAFPKRAIRVVNGGISGYSSFQGRVWFHELGPKVQPDLVIAAYYFSDFVPDICPDKNRVLPGFFELGLSRALSRSHLYQFLRDELVQRGGSSTNPSMVPRVSVDDYRGNLAGILDEAKGMGARGMLLLLTPREDPVPAGQRPYRAAAQALAAAHGIPLVDMEDPFREAAGPRADLFLDEVHPSAAGNRIVADRLAAAIRHAGLLSGSPAAP